MKSKPAPLIKKSLLKMAENAIGSNTYRNFYISVGGETHDALQDGELSCAVFVSNLLSPMGLIDEGHATVTSTLKALVAAGWKELAETTSPEPADIVLWESTPETPNQHIGFYVGEHTAISNSAKSRTPQKHHWTYGGKRQPMKLYRYNFKG